MSRNNSAANNSVSASPSFVLDEYNHVPVMAPGLKKDQLEEWEPFKVRRIIRSLTRPPC